MQFKVDRPQTTVVAKNLSVLQLFISRIPKMCAILQLASAPLNPRLFDKEFHKVTALWWKLMCLNQSAWFNSVVSADRLLQRWLVNANLHLMEPMLTCDFQRKWSYLLYLLTYSPTYTYLLTYYLLTYLLTYSNYLLYIPTYLPTYLPT